jgi:hypothetical protein
MATNSRLQHTNCASRPELSSREESQASLDISEAVRPFLDFARNEAKTTRRYNLRDAAAAVLVFLSAAAGTGFVATDFWYRTTDWEID